MIITLSSLKGGSGKTTLAVHLAHAIALSKKRVLLVDADPQGSAQWEAEIDDRVAHLYGLTPADLKIIRGE